MVTKEKITNYNEKIASQSNNIGQKLFAYIANGKNINDRIREKFKKSLIFIGDEGQIYNPLTNTYVGIGQTAYTHTISYIEDAHEKIAALQKMLASSMVSAIYANWGREDWQDAIPTSVVEANHDKFISNGDYVVSGDVSKKNLPTKIYATNEIVLKGHGDYDPTTRLAATREYAHITDKNLDINNADDKLTNDIYSKTYKKLGKATKWKYTNNDGNRKTHTIGGVLVPFGEYAIFDTQQHIPDDETSIWDESNTEIQSAFATSGITVSLEKGVNRYLYSYTFTNRAKFDGLGLENDQDQWEFKQSIYMTDAERDEILEKQNGEGGWNRNYYGEDDDPLTGTREILLDSTKAGYINNGNTYGYIFFWGLEPVYSDGFTAYTTSLEAWNKATGKFITGATATAQYGIYNVSYSETDYADNSAKEEAVNATKAYFASNAAINKKQQLFKQSANTMVIDDKLTWSYIASAYSYTLNFSKEYTDNQVNRIYRELLGEEESLIPVSAAQISVAIPNNAAELDRDGMVWNSATKSWDTIPEGEDSDNINESSYNLHKYILNYSSTFVSEEILKEPLYSKDTPTNGLNYDDVNTGVKIFNAAKDSGGNDLEYTVLPWKVLLELSRKIAKEKINFKKKWIEDNKDVIGTNEEFYLKLKDTVHDAIFGNTSKGIDAFSFTIKTPKHNANGTVKHDDNGKIEYEDAVTTYTFGTTSNGVDLTELSNILFMGPDQTCESQHADDIFDRTISFETSRGDTAYEDQNSGLGKPTIDESGKGQYGHRGDESLNANYGYSQVKYTLSSLYHIIDAEDVANGVVANKPIDYNSATDEEKEQEYKQEPQRKFYAVNTNYVTMNNINLTDGIQTLKEVAYILDIITDGWGNQYDPEGNGILLTYTIANNHDRIEDHESRLRKLEGGKNIVKSIYKEARSTSKFVNLHFESDTSWVEIVNNNTDNNPVRIQPTEANKNIPVAASVWEDVSTLPIRNASDYYYAIYHEPHLTEGEKTTTSTQVCYAVPQSYIHSYLIRLQSYLTHRGEHTVEEEGEQVYKGEQELVAPKFSDFYGCGPITPGKRLVDGVLTEFVNDADGKVVKATDLTDEQLSACQPFEAFPLGFAAVSFKNDGTISYFKDLNGNEYDEKSGYWQVPTYVGQVGIGIDLNVATTYTTAIYCEQSVDLGGGVIGYTLTTPGFDSIELNSSHIQKTATLTIALPKAISYTTIDTANDTATNSGLYFESPVEQKIAPNVNISHYRFTTDEVAQLNDLFGETHAVTNSDTLANSINEQSTTLLDKYADDIASTVSNYKGVTNVILNFVEKQDTDNVLMGVKISTKLSVNDAPVDYETYRPQLFELTENGYVQVTDGGHWDTENMPHNLFIRKSSQANVKQAYVDVDNENNDALTSVDWVTTYVSHVVSDITGQLKGLEVESYQFTKSLFEKLDSSYVTSYGMYVAGIKQENGIVTPIVRELPKDNISADVTVWGESNTDIESQQYVAVTATELENEVAMDKPLFVINGDVYTEIGVHPDAQFGIDASSNLTVELNGQSYVVYMGDNKTLVNVLNDFRIAKFSIMAGTEYAHFVKCYIKRDKYVQIDAADIRKENVSAEGDPAVYKWQIKVFGKTYSVEADDDKYKIYKSVTDKPEAKVEYLSASVKYQSDATDGVGGNSFKVTAHITKISDATEANSGLVDAYDVKNTFDNMFEWVDLSRWDEDGEGSPVNPVNTTALEAGGNVEAATNISKTKASGNTQLGFPRDFYYDETSEDGRYKKDTTQGTPEELA